MPKNHLLVALKISHPKIQQLITEISSSLISQRVFSRELHGSEIWQNWNPLGFHRLFSYNTSFALHFKGRKGNEKWQRSLAKFVAMKNDIKSHFSLLFFR